MKNRFFLVADTKGLYMFPGDKPKEMLDFVMKSIEKVTPEAKALARRVLEEGEKVWNTNQRQPAISFNGVAGKAAAVYLCEDGLVSS